MEKDFDQWNLKKKNIHKKDKRILFNQREIWWCVLGVNVGYEQDGKSIDFERPVIIVRKLSPNTCVILPLTTKKRLEKFQVVVNHENVKGYALLDQIRVVDTRRLLRKIGLADEKEFFEIIERLKKML